MVISLDNWIELKNWSGKPTSKGVSVIDRCISQNLTMGKTPNKNKADRGSPRKKFPSTKLKEYIVDSASGYCPGCSIYVRETDDGVVCKPCQAYWHYACVGTTQEELDNDWKGISFMCQNHRKETKQITLDCQADGKDEAEGIKLDIKINNFALNAQQKIKDKLSKMEAEFEIQPKDNHRQYYFKMSTPTYHLFIENIIQFGEELGMSVKRKDADLNGEIVKTQFILNIRTTDGASTPLSLTGYHTNNSMLIQPVGSKTGEKTEHLEHFVNKTLVNIIQKVEKSEAHNRVKEMLRDHFLMAQENVQSKVNVNPKPELVPYVMMVKTDMDKSCKRRKVEMEDQDMGSDQQDDGKQADSEEASASKDHEAEADQEKVEIRQREVIDQIRIQLDVETKEKNKMMKEIETLKKKIKEGENKGKLVEQTKEKLEKMTKLKDQMSAAAQALKQNNEVLTAQQATNTSTINSKEDTLQSYSAIIKNNENKMAEKERIICELREALKEKELGIETHKEIAYRLINQSGDEDGQENSKDAVIKELNKKLNEQEEKYKNIEENYSMLQKKVDQLSQDASDAEIAARATEEKLKLQVNENVAQKEKIHKDAKKEAKQLKDALNSSEKMVSNLKQKLKEREEQIKAQEINTEMQKIIKLDQGNNTELAEAEEEDGAVEELNKTISELEESIERTTNQTNTSMNEMSKIIEDKEEIISQLKENSEFMENKLRDIEKEKEKLINISKELKKELETTQKKLNDDLKKHQQDQNEMKMLKSKYAASQLEVSQMVSLNNQLKINKEINKTANPVKEAAKGAANPHNGAEKLIPEAVEMVSEAPKVSQESISKLCYSEVKEKGSCKKNNCFFSHDIPTGMEQKMMLNIIGQRNLCINEFNRQGSCRKRGECRFHHEITAEQRNNAYVQELMKQKQERMRKSRESHPSSSHNLCAYEYQRNGGCPWGENCKFTHKITDAQKSDATLRITMTNKMEHIQATKINRKHNYNINNNNKKIPLQMLSKMYQLLSNTQEEIPSTNNGQDEIEVPREILEKMYKMIDECKTNCFKGG